MFLLLKFNFGGSCMKEPLVQHGIVVKWKLRKNGKNFTGCPLIIVYFKMTIDF